MVKTKTLTNDLEAVKKWGISESQDIVSTSNFITSIDVVFLYQINRNFLKMFEDKAVEISIPMGIHYSFFSL